MFSWPAGCCTLHRHTHRPLSTVYMRTPVQRRLASPRVDRAPSLQRLGTQSSVMMSGRTVAGTRIVIRTSRLQDVRYQDINNRSDAAVAGLHPECCLLSTHRERAMGVSPSGPEDPDTGTCVVLKKIFARKATGHSQRGSTAVDATHWQVIRPQKRFDTETCCVP